MAIAETPEPPYYAVIFTTVQSDDSDGYVDMAKRMFSLAAEQAGYLGFEIAGTGSLGIGISYWTDEASIRAWKANAEHQVAQELGRDCWYDRYQLRWKATTAANTTPATTSAGVPDLSPADVVAGFTSRPR